MTGPFVASRGAPRGHGGSGELRPHHDIACESDLPQERPQGVNLRWRVALLMASPSAAAGDAPLALSADFTAIQNRPPDEHDDRRPDPLPEPPVASLPSLSVSAPGSDDRVQCSGLDPACPVIAEIWP